MRIDKYLKTNGIIKRRVVAKRAIEKGFVSRNNTPVKPASEVKPDDIVSIRFSNRTLIVKVTEDFRSEVVQEIRG